MKKRGRPRGVAVNGVAIEDRLAELGLAKADLCERAGITTSHLADMLHRQKGASRPTVELMAAALGCRPASIAPGWSGGFVAVRASDRACTLSVSDWLRSVAPEAAA